MQRIASRRGPQHPRRPHATVGASTSWRPQHRAPQPPAGLNRMASTSRRPQHGGLNIPDGLNTGASTVEALKRGHQHPQRPQHWRPHPSGGLNIKGLNLQEASIQRYLIPSGGLNSESPHDEGFSIHGGLNIGGLNSKGLKTGASTSTEASRSEASTADGPQPPKGLYSGGPQHGALNIPAGLNRGGLDSRCLTSGASTSREATSAGSTSRWPQHGGFNSKGMYRDGVLTESWSALSSSVSAAVCSLHAGIGTF